MFPRAELSRRGIEASTRWEGTDYFGDTCTCRKVTGLNSSNVRGWSKNVSTESETHCRPKYPTPGDLFNGWKPDDGMSERRDHGHDASGQTEDGPPSKSGVLNVVDILEQTP